MADGDARAELLKLAVRKIVEEALEAEVAKAVGREYYESGAAPGAGYRNGYRRGRLRTAEGAIEYGVPQVTDRAEPFVSRVRAGLTGRTAELQRGRDINAIEDPLPSIVGCFDETQLYGAARLVLTYPVKC